MTEAKKKKGVFSRLMPFYKKYTVVCIVMLVLTGIHVFASTLIPQILQLVIDRVINPALGGDAVISESNVFTPLISAYTDYSQPQYFPMLTILTGTLLGLALAKYITHYVKWNIGHYYLMGAENDTRDYAFHRMLRQSPIVLNNYTSGDLLNVTNNDPTAMKDLFLHHIHILLTNVGYAVLAVYYLVFINPLLVIIPLVIGLITGVIVRRYNKVLRRKYDKIRQGNVELNTYVQENINGVRVVRAFSTEEDELKRFEKRNDAFRNNYVDLARTTAKYSMIFTILGEGGSILSIVLGIILAVRGQLSVGQFATFTSYCATISNAIIGMAAEIGNIQNGIVCANRYLEFCDRPELVADPPEPLPAPKKPVITFKNVGMKFEDGTYAVRNIDLEIGYGKRIGIMGKTGSGKSVLFKLLTRLYDCTEGEILLDGVNIKKMETNEVRRLYSYVMQDVFLFSDTVHNNIALYDEDAPDEKVLSCAESACVADFAEKLSDGYDTIVGEKGLGLSGGQKQRVSIARALLKDAPVILLDDCTSALDYETEKKITDNLYRNYGDRTMLISSHRAGSVAHCDEILYMEDGRIVERGSHDELMKLNGRYCSIYTEQEFLREGEVE